MNDKTEKVNGAVTADSLVFDLRKPVMANGEEVKQLTFREPTAADIERCGTPVHFEFRPGEEEPKVTYDVKAMFAMMSNLAAVPPSTIKQMNTKDWELAALMITHRFFIPN